MGIKQTPKCFKVRFPCCHKTEQPNLYTSIYYTVIECHLHTSTMSGAGELALRKIGCFLPIMELEIYYGKHTWKNTIIRRMVVVAFCAYEAMRRGERDYGCGSGASKGLEM